MRRSLAIYLPPILALAGLSVCCLLLWRQTARFRESVEQIAENVRVSLIDLNGKVVYDSTGQDLPSHAAREEFEAVKTDGRARSVVRESETLHIAMFYHARRVGNFVLRIAVPYQSVTDAKAYAVRGLLAAIGIGALVVLVLIFFMRRYERRLSRLALERDLQDKLLAEMRKLEEFRRDFISNVAHEIKTPVTGILGEVDVLADGGHGLDERDRRELLQVLKDQSVRLDALVDDILQLSRLERSEATRTADFALCNVGDIVETAVNLVRPLAERSEIELRVERLPALNRSCDPRLIESAVLNLVQNAIRHSGTKAVEVVLGCRPDGRAEIRVVDHGVGIPGECQARIFERFYRVDKDRSRALGGTGLGLAIVKHIAQLHGGEVSVVSRPGEGATFRMAF